MDWHAVTYIIYEVGGKRVAKVVKNNSGYLLSCDGGR